MAHKGYAKIYVVVHKSTWEGRDSIFTRVFHRKHDAENFKRKAANVERYKSSIIELDIEKLVEDSVA